MTRCRASAGIFGGLFWIALGFYPLNLAGEVVSNRLWTLALLGILLGFSGMILAMPPRPSRVVRGALVALIAGLATMLAGNIAEYWFLSDYPHEGPEGYIRGLAFMTFLLGTLVMFIASAVVGVAILRSPDAPRVLGILLVVLLPLTLTIGFWRIDWAGLPLGVISVLVSACVLRHEGDTWRGDVVAQRSST